MGVAGAIPIAATKLPVADFRRQAAGGGWRYAITIVLLMVQNMKPAAQAMPAYGIACPLWRSG